jgi:hypothetical protein
VIRCLDYGRFTQVPLPLLGFGREDVAGKGMTSDDFAGAGFLETLCGSPVGFDLRHSAFLQLLKLFFRGDDDEHAPPFHLWSYFDYGDVCECFNEFVQCCLAKIHMGNFPAAEDDSYFCLVPFFNKPAGMLYLEVQVVIVGFGTKLDLLDHYLYLLLAGFLEFFALLVFEFAVIHDPANRRHRGRRYLNEVELLTFCKRQSFLKRQNTELLAVGADDPEFFRPNGLIDVYRGFSYDATSWP